MSTSKCIGICLVVVLFSCCTTTNETTQEQEVQRLNQLFTEIESLAASQNCDVSSEWTFTSYGSKACGGPIGYIAYSRNIDVDSFLDKIEAHKMAQEEFNRKWEVISDCLFASPPSEVICENGNPILEY